MIVDQQPPSHSLMTAIGANFIHFAAGITTIWASTGLYFLSYFHVSGTDNVTSSVIVMLTILPLCLIMIFAAKISKLCGDCNTVRCCAAILMVSQILPNFIFNEAIMTICYFIIPFSMFGLSLISALRCLRTVFPKKYKSHEIICLVSFASGAILWNVILKDLINPNNAKAGEPDKFGSVYLPLGAVTNMVFRVNGVFFVCGVITMVGSLLLQEKRQRDISVQHDEQGDTSRVISIKIIPENASAKQTKTLEEYPQRLTKPEQIVLNITSEKNTIGLSQALRDPRCILLFVLIALIDTYPRYVISSFTIIFMPVINDDQYLITCLVVFFIANIVGVFFWNWLQERRGISYSILIIGMVSLFAGFFGFFSHRAELLMVFMILMGLALIGVDTVSQPGIVEIYNLKLATDLLPFRAVSIVMGGMIGPFLQFSTASLLTPFQFMKFLFIASVLGFGICLYYFIKFPNKRKSIMMRQMQRQKQQQKNVKERKNTPRDIPPGLNIQQQKQTGIEVNQIIDQSKENDDDVNGLPLETVIHIQKPPLVISAPSGFISQGDLSCCSSPEALQSPNALERHQ